MKWHCIRRKPIIWYLITAYAPIRSMHSINIPDNGQCILFFVLIRARMFEVWPSDVQLFGSQRVNTEWFCITIINEVIP